MLDKQAMAASPVRFSFYYVPILLDILARGLTLELLALRWIPNWLFWILQIALGIMFLLIVLSRADKIAQEHGIKMEDATPEYGVGPIVYAFFVVALGVYVTFNMYEDWPMWAKLLLSIVVLVLYGFYVFMVSLFSSKAASPKHEEQQAAPKIFDDHDREPVDTNDMVIAQMETEIHSVSQRVESYTLESALFGALSFSGFLTLLSSDKPVLGHVAALFAKLGRSFSEEGLASFGALFRSLNGRGLVEGDFIAAITLETLICSMLFLSVIVSRLKFYGALKKVDYAVRISRAYNTKEEEIYNFWWQSGGPDIGRDRLVKLTARVAEAIEHAGPLLRDLSLVANHMLVLRHLGIMSFLLILMTSAFLLSKVLGFVFVMLSILAYIYSAVDEWIRERKTRGLPFFRALEERLVRLSHLSKSK